MYSNYNRYYEIEEGELVKRYKVFGFHRKNVEKGSRQLTGNLARLFVIILKTRDNMRISIA